LHKNLTHVLRHCGAAACLAAAGLCAAQPSPPASGPSGEGPRGGHRPPPPEALAACKALKDGQACTFTGPRATINGTCFAPEGKPLACRPMRPPEEGGREPPKKP
jgi:hypothetical protein